MALIIRIAKQFPGRCWYNYDREAVASNSKNWSHIHSDFYLYHTSVAFQSTPPQASRNRKPLGDHSSQIACKSWNLVACPHEFCRFLHRCDRNGCNGRHRAINCQEVGRKRGRSPDPESRRRQAKHDL